MNTEEIKQKLQDLVGLSAVVSKDLDFDLSKDGVSFSIRGNLQYFKLANYYRLNVSTVSFISFNLEDVSFVQDSRIELK